MSKYNEAMAIICDAARMKMALNAHKGDIELITAGQATLFMQAELKELLVAAEKEDYEQVIIECGDTMNFLISIAYNAINSYRRRKTDELHKTGTS